MRNCCVKICRNRAIKRSAASFHRFPLDAGKRHKWVECIRREINDFAWSPPRNARVCSDHFCEEDFVEGCNRLKKNAYPCFKKGHNKDETHSVGPLQQTSSHVVIRPSTALEALSLKYHKVTPEAETKNQPSTSLKSPDGVVPSTPQKEKLTDDYSLTSHRKRVALDHRYVTTPNKIIKKYELARLRMKCINLKYKNAIKKQQRLHSKCKLLIEELKNLELINEDLEQKLGGLDGEMLEMFQKCKVYNSKQKSFALTLHLYGPKAYNYLRSKGMHLPHPRTLAKWLQNIDGRPGINKQILKFLESKVLLEPSLYKRCSMMIDAMSIKNHLQYHRYNDTVSGFVDLGFGESSEDFATEILLAMIVGVTGHWKIPIAYFCTDGLSAESQKSLVVSVIEELQQIDVEVVCLVMDGLATNVKMCRMLGCDMKLPNPKPSFYINGQEIFVILDACHMIKLLRNALESFKKLKSPSGIIDWDSIVNLHALQVSHGLKLANKLSSRHINFHKLKMKVNLAVQTMSRSVALALKAVKDMGYADYQEVDATVEFIEVANEVFDIFNSKHSAAKGTKMAINLANKNNIIARMNSIKEYFLNLRTPDGGLLYKSRKYMFILGFVGNIYSLEHLSNILLQHQKFILSYKFSQDHLELFFNAVRRSGGWNNNPSTYQFQHIFKKYLCRCGLVPGENGNVNNDENEVFMMPEEDSAKGLTSMNFTHPALYNFTSETLNGLLDDAVSYISGWIVAKLFKTICCDDCRFCLVDAASTKKMSCHLLNLKNQGSYLIPSDGVIKICREFETVLRHHMKIDRATNQINFEHLKFYLHVRLENTDYLNLSKHDLESRHGLGTHSYKLINLIARTYYDLRKMSICRLNNDSHGNIGMRQSLTKSITFKNL